MDKSLGDGHEKILPEGSTQLKSSDVNGILHEILDKERASVTFYGLLAERTPLHAVKEIFRNLADEEKGHVAKLAAHIAEV